MIHLRLTVTFIKNVIYNEDECKKLGYLDNMTWDEFKAQNAQSVAQTVDQTWIDAISAGTGIDPQYYCACISETIL